MTSPTTERTIAQVTALVHDSSHSIVYRANLSNSDTSCTVPVVLKFNLDADLNTIEDLKKEAAAYSGLLPKSMQGHIIPKYYGLFHGNSSHGIEIFCIVLEDCGDSVKTDFRHLELEVKYKILTKLGQFHIQSHGYHPRDFAERNVVVKDGEYRLIDFHYLREHECAFDGNWNFGQMYEYEILPKCITLGGIGDELDVWKRDPVEYVDVNGMRLEAIDYPSQAVIDELLKRCCFEELGWATPVEVYDWLSAVRKYAVMKGLDSNKEDDFQQIIQHGVETKPDIDANE
ncbi:hypothetical protein H0H81_000341 [Sphagnurus paluster]|uniref:Protein kinase domain-containing protein n=1 Tax=Sphagnurus paluster TaxID=117069 RepID=A0A9P7GUR0_9AGAR|nr:hypothetical protein H0H81_000341 [Sphagnurus paluster]